MTRVALILLVVFAALVVVTSMPSRTRELPAATETAADERGALHIHTRRSDGTGTPNDIAAAAARAGLRFIVLTDHGDAASAPTDPYYHQGVLIVEGVEVSTDSGHVVALGLPRSPYPLGGEARDVVEDVERLGGFSIAAHPGSAKADLKWQDWHVPVGGIEWLNGDSEWRDEGAVSLVRRLFTYPIRASETLAALLDRPDGVLAKWDEMTSRRRVVAVAAADAHARISLRSGNPEDASPALHLPSYESMFRTFSLHAAIRFGGDAAADAKALLTAIRQGHVYSSVDALGAPAQLTFSAHAGNTTVQGGDGLPLTSQPGELRIGTTAPDGRIVLLKNGREVATFSGDSAVHPIGAEQAAYRVEVYLPGAPGSPPVPWLFSNPIYIGARPQSAPRPLSTTAVEPIYTDGPAAAWHVATSPRSRAAFEMVNAASGTQLLFRWGLGGVRSESPYAALVAPLPSPPASYAGVTFTARADQPMRLSVQLRAPTDGDGERWHRSVYLEPQPRTVTIRFDDMTPRGATSQQRPALDRVSELMFVVDTVNTRPGDAGQVWIDDVKLVR